MKFRTLILATAFASLMAGAAQADTLVVGNKGEDTIGFINLETGEMVLTQRTGQGPHEVAVSPDGALAITGAFNQKSLYLYDVATGAFIREIDLGGRSNPHGIKWFNDNRRVVVTAEGAGDINIVDVIEGTVLMTVLTGQQGSHMVALSPDNNTAYVANTRSNSFTVIDLEAGSIIRIVAAGDGTEGIAVTPDGSEIWVSSRRGDDVMVFDAGTLERTHVIEPGDDVIRVEISPDGTYAVAVLLGEARLALIDTKTKEITGTVALDAGGGDVNPVSLTFNGAGDRLYVSMTGANKIAVIDTGSWQQIATIEVGENGDGLGWSALTITP